MVYDALSISQVKAAFRSRRALRYRFGLTHDSSASARMQEVNTSARVIELSFEYGGRAFDDE